MTTTLLVDGPNVLMRAIKVGFTGIELSSPEGVPTAPVLFFINTVARHIRQEQPDSVIVCWDAGRGHRLAMSASYKAQRQQGDEHPEQFVMAHRFLTLAGIQQSRLVGYEADDMIAGHVATAAPGECCVIVSDDHDLRQLVSDRVCQVGVAAGTTIDWLPETVQTKYGCGPEHLPYLMALMGDPGDGVMGLKGIGPKKGLKLLQKHEFDWPALLDGLDPADRATVELAYRLVDLRHPSTDLTGRMVLPRRFHPTMPSSPDHDRLRDYLESLGMQGVIDRLDGGRLWGDPVTV